MSSICTPFSAATVLEAPLTECALNTVVSILVFPRISFSQLARHWEVTGLCGLTYDRNNGCGLAGSFFLYVCVSISYCRRHFMTHKRLSLGKGPNMSCLGGASHLPLLAQGWQLKENPFWTIGSISEVQSMEF